MAKEGLKKRGNGFVFRLIQAILSLFPTGIMCVEGIIAFLYFIREGGNILPIIMLVFACIFVAMSVLLFVTAFKGKSHIWADVVTIVISSLFSVYGILGIVGGIKGMLYVGSAADTAQARACAAGAEAVGRVDGNTEGGYTANAAESCGGAVGEQTEPTEYISPKTGKKGKRGIMIALCVSYALLLIMGILLATVPAVSDIIGSLGICKKESTRAYGIAIGVMWVTLVPAFGYYFATLSPFELGKKAKIAIAAVSTVLLVAMNVVFFLVINGVKLPPPEYAEAAGLEEIAVKSFFEGSDEWFIPVSTVFASLGMALCYLILLFRIKPENIGNGGNVLLRLFKKLLGFKEKQPDIFILAATLLLTWLAHFVAFVLAIIIIALFVGIVILIFLGVGLFAGDSGVVTFVNAVSGGDYTDGKGEYKFINDMGCEQTVYSSDGRTFYSSDGQYVGRSDDGGKTIKPD